MPNRDGGQDTRYHPNRNVGRGRWHPTMGRGAVEGSQYASTDSGLAHVDPTPHGWSAAHTRFSDRGQAFDETVDHYGAGPFRTEHRAKTAALAMSQRDEDKLQQHRA